MTLGWAAIIHFTEEDRAAARACSIKMIQTARSRDHFGQDSPQSHYHGALGEIAFSRFLRIPWKCHPGEGSRPDVAGYEVRANGPSVPRPYIKSKANDQASRIVLVLIAASRDHAEASGIIAGWMPTDEVRTRAGRRTDPGARGAPAWMLYDLSHLRTTFPEVDHRG